MNSAAIEIDGLVVRRGGNVVLRALSAAVPAGSVAGLLGPSGCGKTTLMRAIVGVQKIDTGTVRLLDLPAGTPALRRRVAYVTKAPSVYADLTVDEKLRYFARVVTSIAMLRERTSGAATEFQAVQFMPAILLPQILLCGLLIPPEQMFDWLEAVASVLPLTFAFDALDAVSVDGADLSGVIDEIGVLAGMIAVAIALAALTLRRRTA